MFARLILISTLFVGFVTTSRALDARFTGGWRIESAAPAPWAGPGDVDSREAKALVGKSVTFGPRAVSAPHPLGCEGPQYAIREKDSPEMLFEGMLAAPDKAGKPRDAATLAQAIGMRTTTVATLNVGCSEIAFHALSPDTLVFALDNHIYTVRRAGQQ